MAKPYKKTVLISETTRYLIAFRTLKGHQATSRYTSMRTVGVDRLIVRIRIHCKKWCPKGALAQVLHIELAFIIIHTYI